MPSCSTYSRCWIVPEPVTRAVGSLAAGADWPAAFDAVTATRSVLPTSASPMAYVAAVAPAIAVQLPPPAPQRFHASAYAVAAPVQLPVLAVSVCPCAAAPVVVGGWGV